MDWSLQASFADFAVDALTAAAEEVKHLTSHSVDKHCFLKVKAIRINSIKNW